MRVADLWFGAVVLALFVLLLGVLSHANGQPAKMGLIRICQSLDVSGEVQRGTRYVMLPAGAQFHQAANENGAEGRVEVVVDAPVSLGLARQDCVTVPARLLWANRPVRVGDTLRARWSLPGMTPEVTVVAEFK